MRAGFLTLLFLISLRAFAQEIPSDSTGAGTLAPTQKDSIGIAADTIGFKFFHDEFNFIEFYDRAALASFFNKWKDDATPKITIAHFGDSHIQPGIFSGEVRKFMQNQKGDGGYGIIFPYSAAKTYPPYDYKTVHYGKWLYSKALEPRPKMPLGVSGMTIRTIDAAAGFNITFRQPLPAHYRKLKFFFKPGPQSFDFRVMTRNNETVVLANSLREDMPYVEVVVPDSTNFVHIQMLKSRDEQLNFEFYGMSLESDTDHGLIYHQLGVGGAPYTAVLEQVLIDSQLPALQADLIILDYGTNDFLYTGMISSTLSRQIIQTINWIKQLAPEATILLTSAQDMYRRGTNVAAAREFSNMVRQIAKQEHCAFYDWYRVSGGQYSMAKWVQARLGRPDYIHLTKEGYLLKGRLFTQAFDHTYKKFEENAMMDSLVMMNGVSGFNIDSTLIANQAKMPEMITTRHRIKSGESLSTIADHYNVSVSSIMAANHMKNSRIVAGKSLMIPHRPMRNAPADVVASAAPSRHKEKKADSTPKTPIVRDANVIEYRVMPGDTLGQIAEKYNTSVKSIKSLNNLKNSRIVEGKTLLIQAGN